MLVESGRLCVKRYGRDAGCRAVITGVIDNNFVKIITSDRAKERRCNTGHLEFLNEKIDPKDKEAINRALGIENVVKKNKETAAPKKN